MKRCVQCQNDLPDSAAHCVYCGSKQPAPMPAAPTAGPSAKTVMGHPGMASELARQAGLASPGPGGPTGAAGKSGREGPPISGYDATQPVSNDPFRGGGQDGAHFGGGGPGYGGPPGAPPRFGGPGPGSMSPPHGFGPPQGGPGFGPGPGYGQPPGYPPPGYGQPPGHGFPPQQGFGPPGDPGYGPGARQGSQPHGFGPPGDPGYGPNARHGSQPQPGFGPPVDPNYGPSGRHGGPPGFGPPPGGPPGFGQQPGGYGPLQGQPQHGYGAPPMGFQRPETELVAPLRPPYLASETGRRASSPLEPWSESLKTIMLVFGVLLVACFVAPWRVQPGQTTFSWTILASGAPATFKLVPILFVATGALAVVLGALPMAALPRGFAAAGIGLAPIVFSSVSPSFAWERLFGLVGAVTLVAGLLVRSQYTGAMLGRLLATIGAVCVLLPLLVPSNGAVPLVLLFQALGQGSAQMTVAILVQLVPVVLALLAFLVWLPPPGRAGAHVIAWLLIVWPLVASVVLWLMGGDIGATLKGGLNDILYSPLAAMAWAALTGYGVATVAGKSLEHR